VVRQVATGVGAAGACLGAISLFASARASAAAKKQADGKKRQAEGDGFITRAELNEALEKSVQKTVDAQDKKHCDLLTALRAEIKSVVDGTKKPPAPQPKATGALLYRFNPRDAADDEYTRNAYEGFDERNAPIGDDEYMRNAYGDEYERNAYGDEYERNAYGDEYERNAYIDDERNAYGDEYERNAYGDDERNAPIPVDEYIRDGYGMDDMRDADGDDERNADGYEAAA
jgi:hypothetical protein